MTVQAGSARPLCGVSLFGKIEALQAPVTGSKPVPCTILFFNLREGSAFSLAPESKWCEGITALSSVLRVSYNSHYTWLPPRRRRGSTVHPLHLVRIQLPLVFYRVIQPFHPNGCLAQLVAHFIGNEEAMSSNLVATSICQRSSIGRALHL